MRRDYGHSALYRLPPDTQRSLAGAAELKGENAHSRHFGALGRLRRADEAPSLVASLLKTHYGICYPASKKIDKFLPKPNVCSIFVLHVLNGERPLVRARRTRPARSPPRSLARGAQVGAAEEGRARTGIVGLLNRGVSIAEIADREGVSERGMRKYVRSVLARRAPQPPEEFLALQVSRLNEALLVAYSAMSGANLQAVDRVVKNRTRTRPLSRLRRRRRGPGAEAGPPSAALPGPARARGAARPHGTEWRRNRLKLLDSRAETARPDGLIPRSPRSGRLER